MALAQISIISGNNNTSQNKQSYVKYDGTKYKCGESFQCQVGETIECYLDSNYVGAQILLNNKVVKKSSFLLPNPTYTLTVKSNTTVTVAWQGAGDAKMYIKETGETIPESGGNSGSTTSGEIEVVEYNNSNNTIDLYRMRKIVDDFYDHINKKRIPKLKYYEWSTITPNESVVITDYFQEINTAIDQANYKSCSNKCQTVYLGYYPEIGGGSCDCVGNSCPGDKSNYECAVSCGDAFLGCNG